MSLFPLFEASNEFGREDVTVCQPRTLLRYKYEVLASGIDSKEVRSSKYLRWDDSPTAPKIWQGYLRAIIFVV